MQSFQDSSHLARLLSEDFESDQEMFETSALDESDETLDESVRRPFFRRSPGLSRASVSTAGGTMPVRFPAPIATAEAINDVKRDTQAALTNLRRELVTVSKALNQSRKDVKALQQSSQFSMLMPLIQQPPQIDKITFTGAPVSGANPATAAYKPQDMAMMLLPMMMGGMGGGDSSSNSMMPMMLMMMMLKK